MFSENLKEQRIKAGLTQDELASRINVSRSAIAKWEQGRGLPNKTSLDDLCRLFGVAEDDLLFDYSKEWDGYVKKRQKRKIRNGILIGLSSLVVVGLGIWYSVSLLSSPKSDYKVVYDDNLFNFSLGDSLVKVGDTYVFSMDDCSFEETGVTIDRISTSGYSYGDGSYYSIKGNTATFLKPGKYSMCGSGFDDENKIEYDFINLRTVYCYDEKDVVLINSVGDLDKIRSDPSGVFCLNANLDLSGVDDFQPIGAPNGSFSGVFINPLGYWIYGLSIPSYQSGMSVNGLACSSGFFQTIETAYLSGIILKGESVDISDISKDVGFSCAGGLAGNSFDSCFSDCHVYGDIKGVSYLGGLVGQSDFDDFRGCSFEGTVTSVDSVANPGQDYGGFGGIAGQSTLSNGLVVAFLENCQVKGTITGPDCVGGVVGEMRIRDSFADTFKNNSFAGSIVCSGNDKGELFGSSEDW
jgi:transcriptional regulator with XRE-family HTH domain